MVKHETQMRSLSSCLEMFSNGIIFGVFLVSEGNILLLYIKETGMKMYRNKHNKTHKAEQMSALTS